MLGDRVFLLSSLVINSKAREERELRTRISKDVRGKSSVLPMLRVGWRTLKCPQFSVDNFYISSGTAPVGESMIKEAGCRTWTTGTFGRIMVGRVLEPCSEILKQASP